jgi:hypothetical protein
MITCNSMGTNGRLGNQLFQYAFLFAIAKKNNYEFGIPFKSKSDNEYYNLFLPECFSNLSAKDSSNHNNIYRFYEQKFEYDESVFSLPDNIDFWGYFQTEKYFKNYRNEILNEFKFNNEITDYCLNFIKNTNPENKKILSIHIRLGDYVNNQDAHPVCSKEYYQKALEKNPNDVLIYAFSDDVEKCKILFSEFNREIVYPNSGNLFKDMCLMAFCDYHIIANSSFSWWGAWLSNSKQVIAPSIWFGPKIQKNWQDVYCEGWIVI